MRTSLGSEQSSVVLVPLDAKRDAVQLFEAAKPVRETLSYLSRCPKEETASAFLSWLEWHEQHPGRICWTVRLADGTAVGEAYLHSILTRPEAAVWVGWKWQGTPVFLDTLRLLAEEAFGPRKFHRLQFTYAVNNVRMKRAMERFGLPVEAVLREAFDNGDGTWSDVIVTSLLRTQWIGPPRQGEMMPSVKDMFEQMMRNFRADQAAGVNTVIQYEVDGENGGVWNAVINDGHCIISEGKASRPNLILRASVHDWLDISARRQSAYGLFLSRRLKIRGDMALALRLPSFFSSP